LERELTADSLFNGGMSLFFFEPAPPPSPNNPDDDSDDEDNELLRALRLRSLRNRLFIIIMITTSDMQL